MHKEEAGKLFANLGNPDRVKIVKMLYHNPSLNFEQLQQRVDLSVLELNAQLDILLESGLITQNGTAYGCNKELVDSLMSFIPTKCSCC